jgi:DNA-binding NtrC family response regulator
MEQKASVLIVDDELGPRESLRMILKPFFDISTAADGKEALDHIQKEKVDLITLDLRMPGLSGIDVLRELRRLESNAAVVIITAHGTLTNIQDAIRFGAVDFVSKPFNVPEIIAIAQKSVAERNCHQQGKKSSGRFGAVPFSEGAKVNEALNI